MTGTLFFVGFGVIAACLLLSAILAVTTKNLIHAVLWLGATLGSTAVLYLLLQAPFMAGIQLLLYVGGVMTLMIFGLMLTRQSGGVAVMRELGHRVRAALVAAGLFGVFAAAVARTGGLEGGTPAPITTAELGRTLLTEDLLAFEALSVLLLAAMIGAIVLARRRDFVPGDDKPSPVSPRAPLSKTSPRSEMRP